MYKINRNFMMQLVINSCKKMQVYHVDDSQDWNIVLDTYREHLLNEEFTVSTNIRDLLGKGAVLSFKKIPLIAFDFTQWQDMIKFLIIWGFLFLLCWRFWQMPIAWLSMLGFFVSECDLETYDGQLVQKIIISRKPLSRIKGELVTIADIDNSQAIQIGEHLD